MPASLARLLSATICRAIGRACRGSWSPSGNSRSLITSISSRAASCLSGALPWRSFRTSHDLALGGRYLRFDRLTKTRRQHVVRLNAWSDSRGGFPAFFGTLPARFGTTHAVVGFVLPALGSATIARLGAGAADTRRHRRVARHVSDADRTPLCAITTGANAIRHFCVYGASIAAVLALLGAAQACLDTPSESLVGHDGVPAFR
jgi:hypothetical protein